MPARPFARATPCRPLLLASTSSDGRDAHWLQAASRTGIYSSSATVGAITQGRALGQAKSRRSVLHLLQPEDLSTLGADEVLLVGELVPDEVVTGISLAACHWSAQSTDTTRSWTYCPAKAVVLATLVPPKLQCDAGC